MSEALEALERVERFALMTDSEVADLDANTIDPDIATIRAALEQPSTAEAQARALEDAADDLLNQADRMENSVVSQRATRDAAWFLADEAKRIREEG